MYKQYGDRGFEIVAISVDLIKNKHEWEKLIIDEKLAWKQYWDKDGEESRRFSVQVFPTNYLIDHTGKIIDKDLSMDELRAFLGSQAFDSPGK